ncbi:MAG: F0F1 ATP synthase subunit A [Thermoflexales bacterium]|nr:F0F1 ATP synthase subunit A [Thermoflexales bacterium]MCS7323852.1 F0F1 ATP synthase subunit A [Thermoflexales bacterium]MCX7938865.1 F0F1 ATP synthase subunit A [Thermoflexales bacterium]MDW8052966.1 F0F1 ATP synthase subunit A [Anaerolineae bacterium]MDW8291619.1 F0F1 ATP synthase subunit A [Anaerolineae bacterium]
MKGLRFLILLIGSLVVGILLSSFTLTINGIPVPFKTFIPNVVVPSEPLGPDWLHNTLFTTLIVDAVIIVLAILGARGLRNTLTGTNWFARAWETYVEFLYNNYLVPTLGSRAKVVAPVAITAFTFIMIAGFFELLPGHESIGKIESAPPGFRGFCAVNAGGVWLITGHEVDPQKGFEASCGYSLEQAQGKTAHAGELLAALTSDAQSAPTLAGGDPNKGAALIPFLRRPTSSLSTTLALAIIAFLFIEIQGIRANGIHYFERFIQVGAWRRARQGMMQGLIGYIQSGLVGPLELISEFIRILTFSFRLFGAMFAGTVLVFVMTSILPTLLPTVMLALEFAIAVIQAFVFMMLVTVFTSLAVAHGEH